MTPLQIVIQILTGYLSTTRSLDLIFYHFTFRLLLDLCYILFLLYAANDGSLFFYALVYFFQFGYAT